MNSLAGCEALGYTAGMTVRKSIMTLRDVSLADKYDLGKDKIFISGAQAVLRMLLMQRERDRQAGLDTAGFVSGYRVLTARRTRPSNVESRQRVVGREHRVPARPQ
jgi:hypothetical protein